MSTSQPLTTTGVSILLAHRTVSANHTNAPFLHFAKIARTLMHQVGSKNVREISVKTILNANYHFATRDTAIFRGMEIGEEEETMVS